MRRVVTIAVLGLAASGLGVPQMPLPFSRTLTFGMVGLAGGQVARLNVLNPGGAGDTCISELSFLDGNAGTLKFYAAQIASGKSIYVDLDRADIDTGTDRVQIRAVVRTRPASADAGQPRTPVLAASCTIIPTLEVFNKRTGRTTVILTN